jgi:hypothetical protein
MKKLNKIIIKQLMYTIDEDYFINQYTQSIEKYKHNINKKTKTNKYKKVSNLLKLLNEKIK